VTAELILGSLNPSYNLSGGVTYPLLFSIDCEDLRRSDPSGAGINVGWMRTMPG
jgi:hypothetical protein